MTRLQTPATGSTSSCQRGSTNPVSGRCLEHVLNNLLVDSPCRLCGRLSIGACKWVSGTCLEHVLNGPCVDPLYRLYENPRLYLMIRFAEARQSSKEGLVYAYMYVCRNMLCGIGVHNPAPDATQLLSPMCVTYEQRRTSRYVDLPNVGEVVQVAATIIARVHRWLGS